MKILVISGPNLNMLGKRDERIYGKETYQDLIKYLKDNFKDIKFKFFQSNHEGKIVDVLNYKASKYDAILINPAAYTHTSVAIHDALEIIKLPKAEVHLSNINEREDFRKIDFVKDVCDKRFMGLGFESYKEACEYLKKQYALQNK